MTAKVMGTAVDQAQPGSAGFSIHGIQPQHPPGMQHGIGVTGKIIAQILPAPVVDITRIDMRQQKVDVERPVAEDAFAVKKAVQLVAQRDESQKRVGRIDPCQVDILGMPDLAQGAGAGLAVPYPAGHQRQGLGAAKMQKLGRQIADPALSLIHI